MVKRLLNQLLNDPAFFTVKLSDFAQKTSLVKTIK